MMSKTKPMTKGIVVGVVVFIAMLMIGAPRRPAPPQPGSVVVRQINSETGPFARVFVALLFGVGAGFGTYYYSRRTTA